MNYPVAIHKERGSDYGVIVPDLPGCFSAGATLDEALAMARGAIELHLEGLIEDALPIPTARSVEFHRSADAFRDATWAIVTVDPGDLRLNAKRVNVTIPERVLDAVDRFADEHGETRSGLLTRAATEYISRRRRTSGTVPIAKGKSDRRSTAPSTRRRQSARRRS